MQPICIPQRIDEPPHLLLWSADELVPIIVGIAGGVFLNHVLIFTIGGFVIARIYRRYRDNRPDGYLFHLLWHAGFWPSKARSMKNPYVRRYIE